MSRLARPAARLSAGSAVLARRLGARTAAWVARGRRHDLTGWRAALGCWARLALLTLGGYLLWRFVRAVPNLMWIITGAWTIAAWRAGRTTSPEAPAEAGSASPTAVPGEAVRRLLLDLMGDADRLHLATALTHLQEHGQWEGRTVTDLRAHLARLGIPHDRHVKVGRVPTWGVRRKDLEASSPAESQASSPVPSTTL
ncbi:hypothetical protein DF268_08555 [Streptomyces sp. V2]|uniref:hypothetical protein n=1 Tax=Streptomyces sp. V2 TaxID=1424099 RepID=UPI000D66B437|nr:hypothetical protein [Streptomyces sp. V2]PWG13908.1 hypothetical protein DF268_08555 [Streptomyces sp. V2]